MPTKSMAVERSHLVNEIRNAEATGTTVKTTKSTRLGSRNSQAACSSRRAVRLSGWRGPCRSGMLFFQSEDSGRVAIKDLVLLVRAQAHLIEGSLPARDISLEAF